MAIKAVDPIAEIGVAREVKLREAHAKRVSQRPAPSDNALRNADNTAAATPAAATPAQSDAAKSEQQPSATEQQQQAQNPSLRFHVDKDTGKTVAELVDPEGQVLRQMPTEEALEIAKAIGKYQGMFVDLKV
jgi:flagellar protein FlaG